MRLEIRRCVRLALSVSALLLVLCGQGLALPPGFTDLTLWSPEVTDHELFGHAVASRGAELVVGAPSFRSPIFATLPGRVYVMDLSGAARIVIENPTAAANDEFGAAVATVGAGIAVGAPSDDAVASDAGAAYLFDGDSGALLHTLLVPGSAQNSRCGRGVAALGADVLVLCDDGVHQFDGSSGAPVRHFTAPGCLGGRGLATIDGDVLSAGYDGTICRLDGSTGAVVQTYVDPEPLLGGGFGSSIGVDGDRIVVGGAAFSGVRESMYVFDATTGALLESIRGPAFGTIFNAGFGTSVAAAGGVLVGSGWNAARFHDAATYDFLDLWRPEDIGRDASRDTITRIFDTGFALWTDTRRPNVGRGSVTVLDRCGNGIHSPAEQCDDGNAASGDGCSSTCRLEACPTLTWPSTLACNSTGTPGKSTITLRKRALGPWAVNADRLVWKWKGQSSLAAFGDPTSTATYQLCFYDDLFGTPDLRFDIAIPASGSCDGQDCWSSAGTSGFAYRDPGRMPSGIETMKIKAKNGLAEITILGKGMRLGLPELDEDDAFPFGFGWAVVLVETSSGECWSAGSAESRNGMRRFSGRS